MNRSCVAAAHAQVSNKKFTIGGKPFMFAGWNVWNVLEGAPLHRSLASHEPGARCNRNHMCV
jgi:hypothetical protein